MFSIEDLLGDNPRRRFERILARRCDAGDAFVLMLVDLDQFTSVSRRSTDQVVDLLLYELGARLRDTLGVRAIVTRSGESQFAILVRSVTDLKAAERLAAKLVERLQHPMHVAGTRFRLSASVGVTLFPRDGVDWRTLLKQADAAAWDAKTPGRGKISISFAPPVV